MAWLQTFESDAYGGVQEQFFRYKESISVGDGIEILFKSPLVLTQVVALWTTTSTITLSVLLPSGMSYDIKAYGTVASFTLNHLNGTPPPPLFWSKLPAGSRLRLGVSDAGITNLNVSLITHPL